MPRQTKGLKATKVPGIWHTDDGRYVVRVQWRDEKTGRKSERTGRADSWPQAVTMLEELRRADDSKRERQRFGDFATYWFEQIASTVKPSTRERYFVALKMLNEAFHDHWLDALEIRDVLRWQSKLAPKMSPATVNGYLRLLRQVLDRALVERRIEVNPAKAVKALAEKRTKGRRGQSLTVEEFVRALDAIEKLKGNAIAEDIARLILCIAWTGIRKGEAFALRWSDITADEELAIERSVWKRVVGPTKTDDPRRVPIHTELKAALDEQKEWLERTQHPGRVSGLMFPATAKAAKAGATRLKVDELSWFRTGSVMDAPLRLICREAKVKEISPHSLRRAAEDLRRLAQVDGNVRRAMGGWRSTEAQGIYTTVGVHDRREASERVLRLVGGSKRRVAEQANGKEAEDSVAKSA